jgi:hypothetical protein
VADNFGGLSDFSSPKIKKQIKLMEMGESSKIALLREVQINQQIMTGKCG